jgi:hypothetical protein
MIYLNQVEIEQKYGKTLPTGGASRFNADSCSKHQASAYKYEFGYIKGYCCYAIIRKRSGGSIAIIERQSFLAAMLDGKGEWKLLDGAENLKNKPISFQFSPPKEEQKFPSALFASHHMQRSQLVIYHPRWQPDISALEANPI